MISLLKNIIEMTISSSSFLSIILILLLYKQSKTFYSCNVMCGACYTRFGPPRHCHGE